jgi:20S proteasome subunit alpha 7
MSFGYDYSCTTLSPEGRIYQIEFAEKAIEIAPTALGIVFSDGVLLASEKIKLNKTIVAGSNPTIYSIAPHIGVAVCGHLPDGRNLVHRAKSEAQSYLKTYGVEITGKILADRLALYVQSHTLYWSFRPFGACAMISSYDSDNQYHLYMVESNGNVFEYFSCSHGKGRQFVKTEVEKDNFALKNKKIQDGMYDVVKILIRSYEGEKETEYDLSVILNDNGRFFHQVVDKDYVADMVRRAKAEVEHERKMQVDL